MLRAWLIESATNQGTNKAPYRGAPDRARVTVIALTRHITQCAATESTRGTTNQGITTCAARDPLPIGRLIRARLTSASGETDADEQDGADIAETGIHAKYLLLFIARLTQEKQKIKQKINLQKTAPMKVSDNLDFPSQK